MALFHYDDVVQTDRGAGLEKWRVQAVAAGTSTVQPIYSDINSTPIYAVSGFTNMAVSDHAGNFDFYIPEGIYDLLIYNDAGVFQRRKPYKSMVTSAVTASNFVALPNPTLAAGLAGISPDGLSTLANQRELYTLSGSRTTPQVGRTIEINDGQTGPASSLVTATPQSASYGLSVVGMRPVWNTSGITGEMDGINVFLRQASSDTAAILTNVGVRSGFAAFAECFTFSADSAGAVVKSVNLQMGVVNPRDGGEYGYNAQAVNGTNLTAAFRANNYSTATWADFFQAVDASGSVLARIRGSDGAYIGGSLTPRVDLGAQIGTAALNYANVFTLRETLKPATLATLGTAAANEGALAYCNDVSGAPAVGAAVTGGGAGKRLVFADGTNWLRVV